MSQLRYHILDPITPFSVEGLEFTPIEVEVQIYFSFTHWKHGSTSFLGFRFSDIVYLSGMCLFSLASHFNKMFQGFPRRMRKNVKDARY